jgi:hypothetical protein
MASNITVTLPPELEAFVSQGLKAASQFDTTTIEVVAAGSSDTVIRNRWPVGETL